MKINFNLYLYRISPLLLMLVFIIIYFITDSAAKLPLAAELLNPRLAPAIQLGTVPTAPLAT